MSNTDITVRWINGISLAKHCDHSEGRASFTLALETQYDGPFSTVERSEFSLTANAAFVPKMERIAVAIAEIMAEDEAQSAVSQAAE